MRKLMLCLAALLLAACGTRSDTTNVTTANGVQTATWKKGPYSDDRTLTINTLDAYKECLRQTSPTMGSTNADIYCRNQTSSGPTGPGAGMGPAYGPGMMSPVMGPGMLAPSGGQFIYGNSRTEGERAMMRTGGTVIPVSVSEAVIMSPRSHGATGGGSDLEELGAEVAEQRAELCKVKQRQGMPCE